MIYINKPMVIVIGGPTASGKTALSIALAKKINGEIVSADSMQIYKDMTIGTAKPTPEEMEGIKHYLVDCVSPEIRYSVADFKNDATDAIEEIIAKGKTPIVVGGTGLYIDSLVYGIEYSEIKVDLEYRNELERLIESKGLNYLYDMAQKIDKQAMEKISRNDKKRICRVLEIYKSTGKTKTEMEADSRKNEVKYDFRVFALDMDRERLYDRINRRVDLMIEAGLIEEVQNLIEKYPNMPTAMQGLGYKEVVQYFKGEYSKDEMIETIKQESRRYAKRQLTWFRKNKDIKWIDASKSLDENTNFIIDEIR